MSDHLAVFNEGRIEQIGAAGRGLRASRRPSSSPASSARPTSSSATAAGSPFAREGAARRRRPSRTASPATSVTSSTSAPSRGYVVDLDGGGELVALQQNLETSSAEALEQRGRRVRLTWRPEHTFDDPTPHRDPPCKEEPHREKGFARSTCSSSLSWRRCSCRPWRCRVASDSSLPTKIGKGEGSLNLIEWTAYSDPSFAKKFEQQTGCTIHRKDAGSSNEMVALMRSGGGGGGGQYDLVSASGDASLRLIFGGDRPAGERPPHSGVEELPACLQVAGAQHRQGRALRRLRAVGAEHAASTTPPR